ncbi:MAG TPA: S41 family peptidase [Terriglobales bacterium]|nr:S41 family peptidase [Terriglobales bacterium]
MAVSSRRSSFLVLLTVLVCGCLGLLFGQRMNSTASTNDINDSLRQFTSVYSIVEQNYAEPLKPDKAIYNGAIPGMLRTLDPHSSFFDPKSYALLHEDQVGKYYGVGMTVGPRNNKIIVVAPFVGSPAYRAGLRPGDTLLAVDGKSTENMNTNEVADMLKGPRGTTVKVTVERQGLEHPLEFSMQRDEIPRYSVDVHELIKPGIGYMHVDSFTETTGHEVQDALDQFGNINGLIIDLRGNPGGLLNEAVDVSDKFLPKGAVIVSHHGRASAEHVYRATHGANGRNYPIVILVNRNTASAAEIVSGALQDHDRALIVGETTFGKGLVQTVYPLSNDTGLALTTARYYTPSGRLIQREYEGVSLFEYLNHLENEDKNPNKELKTTDSGRQVYGGGGITPDVKIETPKLTPFQERLLSHYAFFNFPRTYLLNRHISKSFEVDDSVINAFKQFLKSEKIAYTDQEFAQQMDWVKSSLKSELFISEFGQAAGLQVRAETDPEVQKAIDLLPQAKALVENARKVIADRTQHGPTADR